MALIPPQTGRDHKWVINYFLQSLDIRPVMLHMFNMLDPHNDANIVLIFPSSILPFLILPFPSPSS